MDRSDAQQMISPQATPWFGCDRKPPQFHAGLRIQADTNLHEQLLGLIAKLLPIDPASEHKPRLLELGCGQGALAQRLFDVGYDVMAADCFSERFAARGPAFVALDLNDHAAVEQFVSQHQGRFDMILAVEVIEHLRSPWDFIAACGRLCRSDTHLILTTPNVASWWSRVWFFLTGELWGFGPENFDDPGHISPLPSAVIEGLLRRNGFQCLGVYAAGYLPIIWAYNWKRLLLSLLMLPWRLLMRGRKDGWVLCYHAKLAQ